jgi:hypothetical protein
MSDIIIRAESLSTRDWPDFLACDRSEAKILCDAANKYCPEAVPEIDAVFKLNTYR